MTSRQPIQLNVFKMKGLVNKVINEPLLRNNKSLLLTEKALTFNPESVKGPVKTNQYLFEVPPNTPREIIVTRKCRKIRLTLPSFNLGELKRRCGLLVDLPIEESSLVPMVPIVSRIQQVSRRKYKVVHPVTNMTMQGLRGCEREVSESSKMTPLEYYERILKDNQAFIFNSVLPTSQASYSSGQKCWFEYCKVMHTTPLMTIVPPFWRSIADRQGTSFQQFIMEGFLSYCVNDKGGKPIRADSAGNYLSAVRKYFIDNRSPFAPLFDKNASLSAARTGLLKEWTGVPGNSKSDSVKIPVTLDMLESAQENCLDIENNLIDLCTYTESKTQLSLTCRSSELIVCQSSDHHLLSDVVIFRLMPINKGDYKGIQPNRPVYVKSYEVQNYSISEFEDFKKRMCGHSMVIRDSKTDPFGEGDFIPHDRVLDRSDDSVFDLTEILALWAWRGKPLKGEPFFSCSIPGSKFVLLRHHLDRWFNIIADYFNLDRSKVSPHSIRYAGASTLHAAGFSDSVIMKMGRWDSLCFLRYIKLSIKTYNDAAKALSNRSTFTFSDVQNMVAVV
jgi:hypothetical protein